MALSVCTYLRYSRWYRALHATESKVKISGGFLNWVFVLVVYGLQNVDQLVESFATHHREQCDDQNSRRTATRYPTIVREGPKRANRLSSATETVTNAFSTLDGMVGFVQNYISLDTGGDIRTYGEVGEWESQSPASVPRFAR